jgi:hypothetical protein
MPIPAPLLRSRDTSAVIELVDQPYHPAPTALTGGTGTERFPRSSNRFKLLAMEHLERAVQEPTSDTGSSDRTKCGVPHDAQARHA